VVIFEHAQLYNLEGELPEPWRTDIDRAAVRREGRDLSIVTYGGCLPKALEAARGLEAEGVSAEVLDMRVLRPIDDAALAATVTKTRRLLVVDEGWRSGSLAGEVIARVVESLLFYELDAPPARVCSEEVPIPYAKHLEEAALPQPAKIIAAAKRLVGR
jgi:pyruvate dehydrogenase E1 component beta subunit